MQSIHDRQYTSIWNAVNANNFKQARKIIDKKLSKGPDQYLEALKFYIRGKTSILSEKLLILAQLEELACRDPFISNSDAIELYEEILAETLPNPTEVWAKIIGELRWKCVKLLPKEENLCLHALKICLSNEDIDHARQIINVMEKNFPKNRNYVFWNLTIMILFSLTDCCSDEQKSLWRSLSSAQIVRLAASTKSSSASSAQGTFPVKSIQTPQEILLLHRILDLSGDLKKSEQFLGDSQLGPESRIAKNEWGLWRLRLKRLSQLRKWEDLFNITILLLGRARTKNAFGQLPEAYFGDWIVWDSLILSASELNDYTYMKNVIAEIKAHLDPDSGIEKSWKRNASLAYVKFHFQNCLPFSNAFEKSQSHSLSINTVALIKYLHEYGDTYKVYNDLRPFIEILRPSERSKVCCLLTSGAELVNLTFDEEQKNQLSSLIIQISSADLSCSSGMIRASNNFKFRYLITCSIPEQKRHRICPSEKPSFGSMLKISREAMRLYKSAIENSHHITNNLLKTDRHPIDDMAILASMCLAKIGLQQKKYENDFLNDNMFTQVLQAAAILEFALTHSKHNFQILLLLLRLYSYLGCGSLAMRTYQRLAIKQIQMDTLSYTLFDRISTFHPHPFDNIPDALIDKCSPAEYLRIQQKFYVRAREQISSSVWLSFQYGSYDSIFEMKEVSDRLALSISAVACLIESRKISRLLTPSISLDALPKRYEELPLLKTPKLSDNNDYLTFPSFESSHGPTFHDVCNFLPPPTINRTKSSAFCEHMHYILSLRSNTNNAEYTLGRKWLERYYFQVEADSLDIDGMTFSEALAYEICHLLALIAHISCENTCWSGENFIRCLRTYNSSLLDALETQRSLVGKLKSSAPASQSTLHILYVAHEVGSQCISFYKYLASSGNLVHKSQIENNEMVLQLADSLVSDAGQKSLLIKKSLNEGGWIDRVIDVIHDDIKETIDENFMEEWAGIVIESWKESVIGLSYLKEPWR